MSRLLYTLLLYLILPFTLCKLWWRSLRQPEYRQHMAERYGWFGASPARPVIWLHCVSVGETRAAAPLIGLLQTHYPQYQILLTHATPTGRSTGEQLFANSVLRCYLPYDVPFAVQRFLQHYQPKIGMLMETELWFNTIAACQKQAIPLLLINARLSQKSARAYAKIPQLMRRGLQGLSVIAAQTEADAERLQALGAPKVAVLGNLKFDVRPPADAQAAGAALRALLGGHRPIWLAASTREGEEELLLDAVQQLHIPELVTVIVPRHPQRFDEVASLMQKRGFNFVRRSHLHQPIGADTTMVLGDSMGEMFSYYAASDVSFIGGSLKPLGGQNLIEACSVGTPVLIGPSTFNFAWVSEQAIAQGAAIRVADSQALAQTLNQLLSSVSKREEMRQAAIRFSQQAVGTSEKTLALIAHYLD